jgi:hypothetical protein
MPPRCDPFYLFDRLIIDSRFMHFRGQNKGSVSTLILM